VSKATSATPCAAIRAARSLTPDRTPGTGVPFAEISVPSAAIVTAPSRTTVTSARSEAFCSSTLVGSCSSSQRSLA
jgi:hypothetical protein